MQSISFAKKNWKTSSQLPNGSFFTPISGRLVAQECSLCAAWKWKKRIGLVFGRILSFDRSFHPHCETYKTWEFQNLELFVAQLRVWRNSWLHCCIITFYFPCFCFCPRAWWPLFCSLPRNTFQKLWQTWRWSFGLEINVNCMAVVMKGFTQLRARQCWLQWTRHPPPLWFHSLFSRVLVAAVGLFSRNFDSWIWFLCLFQHQRWLYSHVHTICCFYWRILSLITLCKGCPVPLVEMRYADNACSSLFNDLYKFSCSQSSPLYWLLSLQFSKSIWRLGYWRYKKASCTQNKSMEIFRIACVPF